MVGVPLLLQGDGEDGEERMTEGRRDGGTGGLGDWETRRRRDWETEGLGDGGTERRREWV